LRLCRRQERSADRTKHDVYGYIGFPNYIDADGDGYPENREVGSKGNVRLAVGRTSNILGSLR
jgi:hypothetical protein